MLGPQSILVKFCHTLIKIIKVDTNTYLGLKMMSGLTIPNAFMWFLHSVLMAEKARLLLLSPLAKLLFKNMVIYI